MNYVVGIDIGGTKIAVGIVDEEGNLYDNKIFSNDAQSPVETKLEHLYSMVHGLINQTMFSRDRLLGIGVGAPGPLNAKNGVITCPPNLPNWENTYIVDLLQEEFQVPVVLENDANAATLAEKWIGAAQENNHFVYMTISTGIGSGLYVDGNLVSGSRGNAGDIGHMVIDPSYGPCTCGQDGCFESIASGTAIARLGSTLIGESLTTKQIFDLYYQGNESITLFINDVFTKIGSGCVTLINTFDPEKIIIGGGVSKVGNCLFEEVQDYVSNYALNPEGRKTEIVPSGLKQNSGVIGAAALFFQKWMTVEN
ncbi:ROK family protein [Halobacillus shinanisalinarum]|uniref:ROK family protein n=1 Tax=Halobacillus shinanisalinarum TaxID=2932258 RepID=A0ABY4GYN8_9BACI|nr:ROK family protein [Halobacillus shinanisalinarum]UOQ91897.1 ROK family protein [Halobacillus shinanisalinarum]